jgi:hypothetical protein
MSWYLFAPHLRFFHSFPNSRSQFTASMWTPEQSDAVLSRAREINPDVKTLALPQGLQVERGPDAVVEYIVEKLGGLIDG